MCAPLQPSARAHAMRPYTKPRYLSPSGSERPSPGLEGGRTAQVPVGGLLVRVSDARDQPVREPLTHEL